MTDRSAEMQGIVDGVRKPTPEEQAAFNERMNRAVEETKKLDHDALAIGYTLLIQLTKDLAPEIFALYVMLLESTEKRRRAT